MTKVDLVAAVLAAAASFSIGVRSSMLKKEIRTKPTAPRWVAVAIMVSSAGFGGASLNIWMGAHASWREALCYAGSAFASAALLLNLWRQKHDGPAT